MRLALIDAPFLCADCGRSPFGPSIRDPLRCLRCAETRYRWRVVPLGRFRLVSPLEARLWEHQPT